MTNGDRQVANALRRLQTEEFRPYREFLTAKLERDKELLVSVRDENELRRVQGRAEALKALLDEIDNAIER